MLKKVTYFSHEGPYLQTNEDLVDVDIDLHLYSLIDSFGGLNNGEVTAHFVKTNLKKNFTKMSSDEDATMPYVFYPRYSLETNALLNAFYHSHDHIFKQNLGRKINQRSGASALAIAISENLVSVVNCGNTKAIILRNGLVKPFCEPMDFTFQLGLDESQTQFSTFPRMALGLYDDLQTHVQELLPLKGDVLIILSDGIYSKLLNEDYLNIFSSFSDDHQILHELSKLNNEKGNWDNQSGIILRF